MEIEWYFDFVSPFSYLQHERLPELEEHARVACRPVLLAGLLEHWETRGPAELAPKRRFTYRYVLWYAREHDIPLRMPPAHPFNPLPPLRLAVALGCDRDAVARIFRFVWRDGRDVADPEEWAALCRALGVDDVAATVADPAVKSSLRESTEQAAERGVFGVPTIAVRDDLFWGVDATDMVADVLRDPALLDDPEMQRVSDLPVGVERRR